MKPTALICLSLALVIGSSVAARVSTADEPVGQPTQLIMIQDEGKELSRVQTVFYSAEREASIQLLVMGAVEMGRDTTLVTVISADGETDQFSSDGRPLVKIGNVEPGLHAIVASSESAHGTTLVNFQPTEEDAADKMERRPEPTPPTRMTLAVAKARALRPFVDRIRDLKADVADSEFVDLTDSPQKFNYRVALRTDGTLVGRVFMVLKESSGVSLDGTRIGIFQNGNPVASTTCDENGDWSIPNFEPGVYGLIAAGRAGYAAFAFSLATNVAAIAVNQSPDKRFVSRIQRQPELVPELVPVVLIPPSMCPAVFEAITQAFPSLRLRGDVALSPPGAPLGVPIGGAMVSPAQPGTGGFGGSAESGAFGYSGIFDITGLAGVAALMNSSKGQQGIQTPPIASPAFPRN